MSKNERPEGLVSVKLKTGLRRGNITARAGETVKVGPGLAARLVERGQAIHSAADAKRIKAKEKARAEVSEAARANKVAAPGPEKKGDVRPPEVPEVKEAPTATDETSQAGEGDAAT